MKEHWLPIRGYEELYWVSNLGNVRSIRVDYLIGDFDRCGYRRVVLHNSGNKKRFLVHRLVADAFIGPREGKMTVNHKNGHKYDNSADNLEYMTQSANEKHSFDHLGRKSPTGSKHWNSKLTESQVQEIIGKRSSHSLKELSEEYGVGLPTISMICNRLIWRNVIPA
jgi:HNH endonuclease/NUMOD4 motif